MSDFAITGATTIDSAGTLSLGTTSLGTTIGTSAQTTNINGNVQINESSGTEGQVLTSTGETTAPTWQTPASSTFVGTADKDLAMSDFAITGATTINSAGTLSLGTTSLGTIIGVDGYDTNLVGNVKINGTSGNEVGQVLTSTGATTAPIWQAPASSTFVGTADKALAMSDFAITGATTIDSAGTLSLGTTSLGTIIGVDGYDTNLVGNVKINGSSGTEVGQVLTSTGETTSPTWQTPASSTFVGTADKALDMNGFNINMNEPTNNDTLLITAQSLTMSTIDIDSTASTTTITPNDISFVVNGDTTATYSKDGIALQNGYLPNNLQISQDSILLSNVTKNLELTQTQIKVNGNQGTATQVFTKDATNNVIWANPAFVSIATVDLDMQYRAINNLQSINYTGTDGPLTIYNQAIFDIPPHIPDPVLVNDAASKGYVDTLIGNTQAGETDVLSLTSGTVTYAISYTTKPKVVLSLNTNSTTTFIPIGLYSHTIVSEVYTGFTWASATTSETATISWHSYI
jgi:hypothetical protein